MLDPASWPFAGPFGRLGWSVLGIAVAGSLMSAILGVTAVVHVRRSSLTSAWRTGIALAGAGVAIWAAVNAASEPVLTGCRFSLGNALGLAILAGVLTTVGARAGKRDRRTGVPLLVAACAVLAGATAGWVWRSTRESKRVEVCVDIRPRDTHWSRLCALKPACRLTSCATAPRLRLSPR
jgi:hypothetical protein